MSFSNMTRVRGHLRKWAAALGMATLLGWGANAQAAVTCSTNATNNYTGWVLAAGGATAIQTGTVLATSSLDIVTTVGDPSSFSGDFAAVMTYVGNDSNWDAAQSATLLGNGVGIRWVWGGIVSSGVSNLNLLNPVGTYVSPQVLTSATGTVNLAQTNHYTLRFTMELVVTDISAYTGGTVNTNKSMFRLLSSMTPSGATKGQMCGYDFLQPPPALVTSPELPKPSAPTCTFDTSLLNQVVNMPAVGQSAVPASGSARSAGAAGQQAFNLTASQCGAGVVFNIYFTDTHAPNSTQNYLTQSSSNQVGVRIYHNADADPIAFGPAPTGSTLPSRAPIAYGSAQASNLASYVIPFTAQYVRLPGSDGSNTAGSVTAKTTVTVVYP